MQPAGTVDHLLFSPPPRTLCVDTLSHVLAAMLPCTTLLLILPRLYRGRAALGTDALRMCQLQRQETQLLERGEAVPDELVAETDRLWEPVIRFFLKRTRMLLAVDVKPYIVFDGAVLPAKIEEREQPT